MVRTQIQLSEEQAQILKELSLRNRESMASLIRQAIDQYIAAGTNNRPGLYRQALAVAGKYSAENPDISIEHDKYLDEDYSS
jgi:predicted transcriptional regulator